MSRNPIFRKCEKCGEITEHWRIFLKSYNQEGWACGVCDRLRDMQKITEHDFKGHTMEVVPLESAFIKVADKSEGSVICE